MLGVGFEFVAVVLLPAAAGYFLTEYAAGSQYAPYGMIAGLLAGFSYGIYYLFERVKDFNSGQDPENGGHADAMKEADAISRDIHKLTDKYEKFIKNQEKKNK